MNCSIASALDIVGEPWTLLIVRDAFYGVRRFDDFQENLGIARNVLTARLKKLVEAGVFRKTAYRQRPLRHEYRLTEKGAALFTVIVGLKQWGDRFGTAARGGKPMDLVDRGDGRPLEPLLIDADTGQRLELTEIYRFENGPVYVNDHMHWDVLGLWQHISFRAAGTFFQRRVKHIAHARSRDDGQLLADVFREIGLLQPLLQILGLCGIALAFTEFRPDHSKYWIVIAWQWL
jgi:DNA-binding HxlR family transcriptional regulator